MSLFDQLSNADKDCACCNKVMAQYYDRYLKEEDEREGRSDESNVKGGKTSFPTNARAYVLTMKKKR